MTIEATCKRCRHYFMLEYEPNEFLTETFVRNAAICPNCERKPRYENEASKKASESAPSIQRGRCPRPNDD